jgi:hypothetical protein
MRKKMKNKRDEKRGRRSEEEEAMGKTKSEERSSAQQDIEGQKRVIDGLTGKDE